jgi:hypothetical protein
MIRHYEVTLTAAAQNVATALGLTAATDIPFRQLFFQTFTADAYLGGSTVSTSSFGMKLLATGSPITTVGGFDCGPLKLSDFYAVGNTAVVHILGIPF